MLITEHIFIIYVDESNHVNAILEIINKENTFRALFRCHHKTITTIIYAYNHCVSISHNGTQHIYL